MNTTVKATTSPIVITPAELLAHWQGHRDLTRRVIEAFPEEQLYTYSLGGMRPFGEMVQELLAIAAPGTKQIAGEPAEELNEHLEQAKTKAGMLALWDESTEELNRYWAQIPEERFRERILAFGQYEGTVWSTILYFIDNEIHHRGQGYVYLRTLGIEPPQFWDR
ncbi:DinB family protein [Pontibacter ramchanderi]|uniref:Putative damage-inducible protein DinB n=1 Tax=Pontibacter ramchanderi TaxID=1179743 RepID=A0A2N3U815_9BACT|nr:DinB family protein [Pontibacter ramchanderi]PKV62897.1 putative damage-inducible protein DinB [Pontibacter ramchanderi]